LGAEFYSHLKENTMSTHRSIKILTSALLFIVLVTMSFAAVSAAPQQGSGVQSADHGTHLWSAPAGNACGTPGASMLVSGLAGSTGAGSAVGPSGALFVTEAVAGRIVRVDPRTGAVTTFASGLPAGNPAIGIGGVMDVAFIGSTAYALVTLVGSDVGGSDVVGIYRVDGPNSFTVVADIGQYAIDHPPTIPFPYEVPSGVQYALEVFRGGFLVTDGHHNRVLRVTLDGEISEVIGFGDVVPTGLDVSGNTIYLAEAGPVPHNPEDGMVVRFTPNAPNAAEVASGAPLLVDVEFGRGRTLFALSQGDFPAGGPPGAPAMPDTGSLVRANGAGTFSVVADGLDLPTSLQIIQNTAYVATLSGEVWKIENIACPPYGK
jgi:sugar lactone lactonase YvrE